MNDTHYMKQALELARKGAGFVNPNPMVGAVIVKQGTVIGQGYHQKYGGSHAESNAFTALTESAEGADLYVTLEPCCHWGKNPPCTDAILRHKIRRVIIGSGDPNPLVNGKGAALLRSQGIEVVEGMLKEECDEVNRVFFHFIRTGKPYVVMKYAMTLDGKIAAYTGKSKWITGEAARTHVQKQRAAYMAIMTGVGTVIADDPLLTCRIPEAKSPLRIICDTRLRTPLEAKVVATAEKVPTMIVTCCGDQQRFRPYQEAGCEIVVVPEREGHTDLGALMKLLGRHQIDSVFMEGGAALNWSALSSGIVNKLQVYMAPLVLGGDIAKGPVGGKGAASPDQAFRMGTPEFSRLGTDWLLESEVLPCLPES
ncbi:MAG: bifunctional diaminohydroxyphosphoribosylaminopyrimidine deaminase/5-amino-6-(5-phosphoribosylamino)uracil reductase RibD [Lachnospiraceae bacterium]